MKQLKNQKGVAVILEVILLAAVLATVGYIGYRAYTQNQAKKTTETRQETKNVDEDANEGYLVVKEFGIRFKPTAEQGNLQYVISNYPELGRSFADFTTKELLTADSACTAAKASLGSVGRYKVGDSVLGEKVESMKNATKIGDYYYLYFKAGGAQCSDDVAASNLQTQQLNILRDTINAGIEAAQ